MIRLVIVEDELLVRVGIKMIIENCDKDIEVVAALSNANDALSFFEHNHVDILLTDINLPGINGIDLIKTLKSRNVDTQYIILSCFAEFEYAREAYELGVEKYILKHELNEEELVKTILDVYKKSANNKSNITKNKLMISNENQQKKYKIAILTVKSKINDSNPLEVESIDYNILENIVKEIAIVQNLATTRLATSNKIVCTFQYSISCIEDEIRDSINTIYKVIVSNLENYFNADVYLSVSKTFSCCTTNDDKYQSNYNKTIEFSEYVFYLGSPSIKEYETNFNLDIKCDLEITSDRFFDEDWLIYINNELRDFFGKCRARRVYPNYIRIQIDKYINKLINYVEQISDVNIKDLFREDYPSYLIIEKINDVERLSSWVNHVVETIHMAVIKASDSNINRIINYIDKNFSKDLSLTEISNKFHMTPTYFSKYYKKCTGTTYINYLNNKRIEMAKQYLVTTDHNISEIAHMVGMHNTNYFFRIFKKVTGETANNYRKNAK